MGRQYDKVVLNSPEIIDEVDVDIDGHTRRIHLLRLIDHRRF
jgi:hypothetical protein